MGKSCCIAGCKVSSDDVEYFKFPAARALRASWLAVCGAAGDVCAAHFAADDYTCTRTGRRLRPGAVPSVLLPEISPSKQQNEENTTVTDKSSSTNDKVDNENKTIKISASQTTADNVEDSIDKESGKAKSIEDTSTSKAVDTRQDGITVKENGSKNSKESLQHEEKDIEEMITNYQIKQTKTLADRLNPEPLEDLIPSIMSNQTRLDELTGKMTSERSNTASKKDLGDVTLNEWNGQFASRLASQLASKLDSQLDGMLAAGAPPIFIEVPVTKDVSNSRAASPEDCLMVLESVQCDIDPSSLMLPEHGPETDSDMEIVSVDPTRKEDPISLLTSSDEDEVIIEEPHIDTVEVSDETDEDDKPLTTLIKTKAEKVKTEKNYVWGMYEFYCVQCDFRTFDETDFKKHMLELVHSRAIQICPICSYTTASKAQYSRHKRKHKDERNYKCHLCNYKARHNMSLIYHLKSHNSPAERSPKFTCDKCGFSSHLKSEGLKHIKVCDEGDRFVCDLCNYSTKRRSDLKRHRMRRHSIDDEDEDFTA